MFILVILLAIFFALNMGGASFAAAFAAPYGSKLIKGQKAGLLFILFVILGSVLLGKNVSITLGQELMPPELISPKALAIIFFSAGLSMFVSNMMKIPQSTSLVTVAAIAGVGAFLGLPGIVGSLLLGSFLGALAGGILIAFKIRGRQDPIPFGPFLATGAMVSMIRPYWWNIIVSP